jgi:hypothetical protein
VAVQLDGSRAVAVAEHAPVHLGADLRIPVPSSSALRWRGWS